MRIRLEVSAGELLDRIAILEIKLRRLGADVSSTIERQLTAARSERDRTMPPSVRLRELEHLLWVVNHELWDIEEAVRACEKAGDFGERFVFLARRVYSTNDKRAALKRQVDELVGSPYRELKSYPLPEVSQVAEDGL